MTSFSIRPYASADHAKLQAIRAEAFAPVFASFRALLGPEIADLALTNAEAEQAALLTSLCIQDDVTRVFLAERGGEPIGFVCVKLDRDQRIGELVLDAVEPAHASRGVGAALFEAALHFMRAEGMRVAVVGVGGDESHAPARRAYAKAGFNVGIPSIHLYRAL